MTTEIEIPHNWQTREYQRPLWNALNSGVKRAVAVWHRRAGKDSLSIHWTSKAALQRVGTYWHMLPTLRQGRLVIWDGITKDGQKVLNAWPGFDRPGEKGSLVKHKRNDEMKLELVNGSVWQVVGSDNYNSLMGANPVGVVFSEYSLADPAAWDFIRPILAENGGWALFLYTPRGPNHGQTLYDAALKHEGWFAEKLDIEATGSITKQAVEDERRAGMSDEMIRQEFYCSFDAPLQGAYYGQQMSEALDDGRICSVPHDPAVRVETWWDLGIGDATAIWFVQRVGREIHLIDYYEESGEGLAHYAKHLEDKKKYHYSDHYLPHDVMARELSVAVTRLETLKNLGIKGSVVKIHRVEDGIEGARNLLTRCWFDAEKCKRGIDALRSYRKSWNDERKTFERRPYHDWSSHGADAFRIGAMAVPSTRSGREPIEYPEGVYV